MARGHIPRFGPLFWSTFAIACVLIAAYVLWLVVPALDRGWTRYRLCRQLREGDTEERTRALTALQDCGVEPFADLIDMLEDPEARAFASNALIWLRPKPPEVIRPLTKALADEEKQVRWNAAYALADVGEHADSPLSSDEEAAVCALCRATADQDERVRIAALQALGAFGAKSPMCVPALLEGLKDENGSVRLEAARGLLRIDSQHDSQAVPVVLQSLSAKDRDDRRTAVFLVQQVGSRAKDVIPQLIDLLNEDDAELRNQVAKAIGSMGADAAPAVAALVRCVQSDPDFSVQCSAAQALGEMGPAAKSAVPTLQAIPRYGDSLGGIAAGALQKITPR